jgi:alpha/beta superfamily hydrolase
MESFVEFQNSRRQWLRGMLHLPEGKRRSKRPKASRHVPGVVLFHGFTGDRMESHWMFVKCSRALARAGMASLRFDFYGSGESDGEFREMTLRGEIADARSAVEFFRRQKVIDPARLGLLGISLGGAVAAALAPRVRPRALVLWSALAHTSHLRTLAATSIKPIPGNKGRVEYEAREISPRFLDDALRVEPLKSVARFKGPTLIIQPEKDEAVPSSHAEDYFCAAGTATKQLVVIPGADHVFTSVVWEHEVIARTVEWFRKCLLEAC